MVAGIIVLQEVLFWYVLVQRGMFVAFIGDIIIRTKRFSVFELVESIHCLGLAC